MQAHKTEIPGCVALTPKEFKDERGVFVELYKETTLKEALGHSVHFVQQNLSTSQYGVIRGLHFQRGAQAQAKLIRVLSGTIHDVVLDLRPDSPTFGKHASIVLSDRSNQMLFVPRGCAHGFEVLSESAQVVYLCDHLYAPDSESGVLYKDPSLNIAWKLPESDHLLSEKDLLLPLFKDLVL